MTEFDEIIDRVHTGSVKWDAREQLFGSPDVLPMWVADMDFRAPAPVIEALARRVRHGVFGYQQVEDGYYESIQGWWRERHGVEVARDWLLYTPGVVPALALAVNTYTHPGDRVVIQPPVYPPFTSVVEGSGRRIVHNPLVHTGVRYEIDFADLEHKLEQGAEMLILCNPHNPVGRAWTRDELSRLAALCAAQDTLVVSDEIHADLVFAPRRHTSFAEVAGAAGCRFVLCAAPSKTFNIAGFHSSYVIIPDTRTRRLFGRQLTRLSLSSQNALSCAAVEAAYREGGPWLDSLLPYLADNLSLLRERLGELGLRAGEVEGTYLAWIDCRDLCRQDEDLKRFWFHEAKVGVNIGSTFGPGGDGFVRLNAACPRATVEDAIVRIESAVRARG
ncbi:MAG: pyridoxal phosphate-dependent aminotransferase [Firmicutes bacterium]|nr:pyridoxal phosphate-dependent aminotransferase [Bacillota bacterium]